MILMPPFILLQWYRPYSFLTDYLCQARTQNLEWVGSFLEKVDLCSDLCRMLALSP